MIVEAELDGEDQRRPLLSSSSSDPPPAAGFSSSNYYPPAPEPHNDAFYPPPINGAVYPPPINGAVYPPPPSPASTSPHTHGLPIAPQGPCPYGGDYQPSQGFDRDVLDEVEIRNLLIDHVGDQCCWGSQPARTWKISSIKDCIVHVGTLETFIEQRDSIIQKEPYYGRNIDGRDHGPVLGVWELDLRSEFPPLFVEKEARVKIPHSEATEKCSDCKGRREIPCPTCNAGQKLGFCKANQKIQCNTCYGRGLLTCQDGSDDESDTVCGMCNGQGMVPCTTCRSRGRLTCKTCDGCGSLLAQRTARVRWKTLVAKKVSVPAGAASVPEEVFHRAKGVQLCNIQAYQCTPAFFADSYPLNQFSSEVVASRLPVPTSARVISERHIISAVPVTRITMSHRKGSFSFYVVGHNRDVFVRDYPAKFCWGLCCCFEWLWS